MIDCFLILVCALTAQAHVVDGDTIDIGEVRVRLWGIDAPEMREPGGVKSRLYLRSLIQGKYVTCKPKDVDRRYRRVVAMCFYKGKDIARIMVDTGHARDWYRYSKGYYLTKRR